MVDGRRERPERFEMKSGGEMYRDFPGRVRASTPLYIKSAGAQVGMTSSSLHLKTSLPGKSNQQKRGGYFGLCPSGLLLVHCLLLC